MKIKMSKKILIPIIVLLLSGGAIIGDWFVFPWQVNDDVLVILHTNDEHGTIENFGKIAYQKRQLERKYRDVLLLSAGDIFSGNPLVDQYIIDGEDLRGQAMVDLMNLAGYDAMVIGNHEFDYGQERLQQVINSSEFPFLLANIELGDNAIIEQPDASTILETDTARKIAILALLQVGPGGIPSTHPDHLEGLSFNNPLSIANDYLYLADESDLFLALTHLGYSVDMELARRYPELDLIIGGHSHTILEEGQMVNDVLVTQAGSNTSYLGKIKITYDEDEIISREAKVIPIDEIDGSIRKVEKKINEFEEKMAGELKEVLIRSSEPIIGREALGSLMTDALVKVHNLDFAFQHNGGIRRNSLPRVITVEDIYQLDPFNNSIVVREMTAREIRSMLYRSFVLSKEIHLQVAGLKYRVVLNEKGDIKYIDLRDEEGKVLEEDSLYRVGMNSYLAHSYFSNFPADREEVLSSQTANSLIVYLRRGDINIEDYRNIDRTGIVIRRETEVEEDIEDDEEIEGEIIAKLPYSLSTIGKREQKVSAGILMANAAQVITEAEIGTYPSDQLGTDLDLSPGNLYKGVLDFFYTSFRYGNTIMVMDIKGAELEKLIYQQAIWYQGSYPLQFSEGIRVDVDLENEQVLDINIYMDDEPLDPDRIYKLAVNSFKFDFYKNDVEVIDYKDTGIKEKELLLKYLRK
ncbi:5'-nucleotidase C-terminal domain-containing protein [Natronospora cellulosivora (SeqCode)]